MDYGGNEIDQRVPAKRRGRSRNWAAVRKARHLWRGQRSICLSIL